MSHAGLTCGRRRCRGRFRGGSTTVWAVFGTPGGDARPGRACVQRGSSRSRVASMRGKGARLPHGDTPPGRGTWRRLGGECCGICLAVTASRPRPTSRLKESERESRGLAEMQPRPAPPRPPVPRAPRFGCARRRRRQPPRGFLLVVHRLSVAEASLESRVPARPSALSLSRARAPRCSAGETPPSLRRGSKRRAASRPRGG